MLIKSNFPIDNVLFCCAELTYASHIKFPTKADLKLKYKVQI